jgi:GMP synthase-like glutamine amidotransferase
LVSKIHIIQHVPFETAGSIIPWLDSQKIPYQVIHIFKGDQLPPIKPDEGLIVMGGPMSSYDLDKYSWIREELAYIKKHAELDNPILGICLGSQMLAAALDHPVKAMGYQEVGWFPLELHSKHKEIINATDPTWGSIFQKFLGSLPQVSSKPGLFHWHGDQALVPEDSLIFSNQNCKYQGFLLGPKVLGFQFHAEMSEDIIEALIIECKLDQISGEQVMDAESVRSKYPLLKQTNSAMIPILEKLFT